MIGLACGGTVDGAGGNASGPESVHAVASMYPWEYFTERIGGERVRVDGVVPAGGDAHDFEPTPDDLRHIANADLFIYNGLGFESWVDSLLAAGDAPDIAVQASSESNARYFGSDDIDAGSEDSHGGEDSHGHEDGELDPHMWLDPVLAITQARAIEAGLTAVDPDGRFVYEGNTNALIADLTALDGEFSSTLQSCRGDTFVTSHDSFNYMAARYDLNAVGISGINPEAEPSPKALADLSEAITETGIRYVLVSPIDSERMSDTLARETGVQALPLHSLQNMRQDQQDDGETYFTLMGANLESLAIALECAS